MLHKSIDLAALALGALCLIAALAACGSPGPSPTPLPTAATLPTAAAMPTETVLPSVESEPIAAQVESTPIPDGAVLVETYCTKCHDLDRITSAHKTYEQWAFTITHKVTL